MSVIFLPRLHPAGNDNHVPLDNVSHWHPLPYGEGPGCRVILRQGGSLLTSKTDVQIDAAFKEAVKDRQP